MEPIPGPGTIITDATSGTTYQLPFIDVQPAQAVDFRILAAICGVFLLLYLTTLFRAKKKLTDHIKDVVIVIFNLYGISVCVNVIHKAWNFIWKFEFVHEAGLADRFVIPQMGVDELVLIFIGSVAVALILADQVISIMIEPIRIQRARLSGVNVSLPTTSTDIHSSTPPKATSAPPSP